jgi:hypothetical protein
MSSRRDVPLGVQKPRVRVAPRVKRSEADDAEFLSAGYGLVPDEWQRLVLEDWLAVRPDGKWASMKCGLSVPRQNGKNGLLEMRELFGMVALGEKFLHTAHEVKTARKAFLRLASFFENPRKWPELAEMVREIRKTNGQEAIVLDNGGSVEFVARSKGSGRGFTVDVLVMDEAQELSDDALEALMPTTSAAPTGNPQWILTGTPPGPKANGEVFSRTRDEALEEKSTRLCWHEWSMDPDGDLDDPRQWAKGNPALGIRLQADVVEGERGSFSDEGFARERGGLWDGSTLNRVIDEQSWSAVADPASMAVERLTLAVDVAPDRSVASVSLAGRRVDGLWHVELDEHRKGADWISGWVSQRAERNRLHAVVVDVLSGLAEKRKNGRHYLKGTDVEVTLASSEGRDMAIACAGFFDAVMSATVRHTDQPQVNAALSVAGKRPVGSGWAWNKKSADADITPTVSQTLALWGAQNDNVNRPSRSTERRRVVVRS